MTVDLPYVRIDNLFNDRDLKLIDADMNEMEELYKPLYFQETQVYRVRLDEVYTGTRRSESAILQLIQKNLYSEETIAKLKGYNDLAYELYSIPHSFNTTVSQMRESQEYRWHKDISFNSNLWAFMSFMWYANDDFKGGELLIDDGIKKHIIKPQRNMLILMPAYYLHKVNRPVYEGQLGEDFNWRTTINGFMNCTGATFG